MIRVWRSGAASEAPRFTAVVVFPTPPFWLAIAITRPKLSPSRERWATVIQHLCRMQGASHGTLARTSVPRGTHRQLSHLAEPTGSNRCIEWARSIHKPPHLKNDE